MSLLRVPTSEAGTEANIETVKFPTDPVKKTLVKLNPDPTGSQDYGPCGVSPKQMLTKKDLAS